MSSEKNTFTNDNERKGEDEALAAELALGVLSGDSQRAAEERTLKDPDFFRLVAAWQARLGGLAKSIPSVAPPSHLWNRIEKTLFFAPAFSASTSRAGKGIWHSLFFWRTMTLVMTSFSIIFVTLIGTLFAIRSAPSTSLLATLHAENSGPVFLAQLNPGTSNLTIRPVLNKDDVAHDLELWLIPKDKVARSLGVLSKSGTTQVTIPNDLQELAGPEAILAITIEPLGGSPTGKATGPIIAAGPLTKP